MKVKCPDQFASPSLFRDVTALLAGHAYRLHVRRFVLDLFGPDVMRRIVLGDAADDTSFA